MFDHRSLEQDKKLESEFAAVVRHVALQCRTANMHEKMKDAIMFLETAKQFTAHQLKLQASIERKIALQQQCPETFTQPDEGDDWTQYWVDVSRAVRFAN